MITTNLSDFGRCEIRDAIKLLEAMQELGSGLPDNFSNDNVTIACNDDSGTVFITNSYNQIAMLRDKKLEKYYCTPVDQHKGFADELRTSYENFPDDWEDEDIQYLVFAGVLHTDEVPINDDGEIIRD